MIDESFPQRLNVNYAGYEIVIASDDRVGARINLPGGTRSEEREGKGKGETERDRAVSR